MKSWVTQPEIPGIYKIRIFKDLECRHSEPWVLILPTRDMTSRTIVHWRTWKAAFDTAMSIQDGINRNWT